MIYIDADNEPTAPRNIFQSDQWVIWFKKCFLYPFLKASLIIIENDIRHKSR